jgi:hypothetical protein
MVIARQSTARTVIVGPVLDSSGAAVTTEVVGNFKISKNGGAVAALDGSATLTHQNTGYYALALAANDLNTVGPADIIINDTTNACPVTRINVFNTTIYDALYAAGATGFSTQASVDAIAGYVDTEVAAIKAKTDNLPSDPADASDIVASFSTVNSTLATIAGYVDTEVAAIKAKTDNLPAAPAATSDIPTAAAIASAWGSSVVGNGRTRDYFLQGGANKVGFAADGLTFTVYSTDDLTPLYTGTATRLASNVGGLRSVDPT